MSRCHFGRQPARMVLVDLSPPFDQDVCHHLQVALEHVLMLACGLNGPSRLPFFGLYALGSYPEALLPLQPVRGNYGRLQGALTELQTTCNELSGAQVAGCVAQGLREAFTAFQRQAQGMLQTAGYWCQLEVTIFTCQQPTLVARKIEKVTGDTAMEWLRKVQIVCINHPDKLRQLEEISGSQASTSSSHSSHNDLATLAETTTVEADLLSLETYLKHWLHDSGTDREHLHLIVQQGPDEPLTLKCDFQERILNAASLPFTTQYHVHPETMVTKAVPSSGSKSLSQNVPVMTLEVIKKFPEDSICESIVFGLPLVVRATSCWKIDWDDLETNQLHFQALCHLLHDQKQVLLARLRQEGGSKTTSFRYHVTPPEPSGHFLLLPSPSNSLLLKSVCPGELLLPGDYSARDAACEDSLRRLQTALDRIEEEPCYNPLSYNSNLYPALSAQLVKGRQTAAAGPHKRKFVSANARAEPDTSGFVPASTALAQRNDQKQKSKTLSGKEFYSQLSSPFPTEL